jgi:tRNA-specific adenosine deaminase 2
MQTENTFTEEQCGFMKEALAQAQKALDEGEVPVGCVLVHNNQIIGRGANKTVQTRNVRVITIESHM